MGRRRHPRMGRTHMILDELAPDLIKQVDDRAECEWLLMHLEHRAAVLLWDHYAEGISVRVLARREGMSAGRVLSVLSSSCRRLRRV